MRTKITFFQRRAYPYQFSIEKVFDGIKAACKTHADIETKVVPFFSQGLLARVRNILWVRRHAGRINHVTGDIHYAVLGLPRRGSILTVHDLNFMNHPSFIARLVFYLFWLYLPVWWVQYITVISQATKDDLIKRLPRFAEKVKVIPNYYDAHFVPSPRTFNKTTPRILQIGTKANKNVLRLIKAIEGISCKLVVIGMQDKVIEDELRTRSINYEWFSNLSNEQLADQYQNCDIVSLVSLIEGFGLPIVEGQAVGRAVITSSLSSMPEVAGDGACLVDPYDPIAIRNGIIKIVNDDPYRESIIRSGFANVQRFTLNSVSESYLALYSQIESELN